MCFVGCVFVVGVGGGGGGGGGMGRVCVCVCGRWRWIGWAGGAVHGEDDGDGAGVALEAERARGSPEGQAGVADGPADCAALPRTKKSCRCNAAVAATLAEDLSSPSPLDGCRSSSSLL